MISAKNKVIIDTISKTGLNTYKTLCDYLEMAKVISDPLGDDDLEYALKMSGEIKTIVPTLPLTQEFNDLYWQAMLFEASYRFESFLLYMEKNRRPDKRFYQPRARTLKIVVDDLQDLEDGVLDFLGISLPPRVGKSTLCIFFLAWIIGKRPASHNAMSGHSGILADRFYNDVQKLTENEEYTYHEIFPNVQLYKKSADKNELSYDEVESFATLTCRGIDGTWTGAVDISSDGYLYVDDLVRDRTESLSPVRLENRYQDYLNVLVDRKNDGSRELMVGTRWNVIDPLGKVETENKYNPRYRFRKIPALNENDESNFDYEYGKGFSTKYYVGVRNRLDKNEWEAKYQQRPFIREGLIFPVNELAYFNGIVPDGGFVRVVGVTDVAWGGGDSLSMPVGYEYENGLIYIVDWIFNKGTKETTIPLVCGKIMGNSIQQTQFEADNGGEMYAKYVSDWLISQGYKCSITHKKAPNKQAKLARIIQYSDDIKRNFRFLSPNYIIDRESDKKDDADKGIKRFRRSKEYDAAMDELTMLVAIGKNEHDDSGDSLAQLENFREGDIAKVEIWSRAALGI